MEVIFVVYADGQIVELDLSNGQVLRQIQTLQGQYVVTPSVTTSITRLGDPFNASGAIFIQHKNATKASILNCAEVCFFAIILSLLFDTHSLEPFGRSIYTCCYFWRNWNCYLCPCIEMWKLAFQRVTDWIYTCNIFKALYRPIQ